MRLRHPGLWLIATSLLVAAAGCGGCGGEGKGTAPAGSAAPAVASAPAKPQVPVAVPVPPEVIAKVVNPKAEAVYSGPTGTLKGRVRIKGDPPPESGLTFPVGKCGEAAATYGRLFRVGQDGALADALVTVVGYSGFVPEKEEAEKITLHGCAFSRRTLTLTFGQRVEVANLDPVESYMPFLDGGSARAVMVAVPRGDAVRLYPQQPGHYMLRDQLPKPFLTADVFVLKFPTHDVTDLDGTYEIAGIPVGKVMVVAYLPALHDEVKQEIEIKPGENTADLELSFDLAKWNARKGKGAAPAAPSASASASKP